MEVETWENYLVYLVYYYISDRNARGVSVLPIKNLVNLVFRKPLTNRNHRYILIILNNTKC